MRVVLIFSLDIGQKVNMCISQRSYTNIFNGDHREHNWLLYWTDYLVQKSTLTQGLLVYCIFTNLYGLQFNGEESELANVHQP